jgi:hypothetical protein
MFKGHQIAVRLSLTNLQLYVDGVIKESAKTVFAPAKEVSLVRSAIEEDNLIHIIEVYGKSGFFRPKIKICVDDDRIAGDDF